VIVLRHSRDDFDRNLVIKSDLFFQIFESCIPPYRSKDRERQKMTNGSAQVVFNSTNGKGEKACDNNHFVIIFCFLRKFVIIIRLLMSIVQRAFIELEM
jgi:hypothetical protein